MFDKVTNLVGLDEFEYFKQKNLRIYVRMTSGEERQRLFSDEDFIRIS